MHVTFRLATDGQPELQVPLLAILGLARHEVDGDGSRCTALTWGDADRPQRNLVLGDLLDLLRDIADADEAWLKGSTQCN